MSENAGPSVLLIGLDAACERVLNPLIEANLIPNLAAVMENGVSSPLKSQIPPWTPSAWPSLYTGVNPGKHGVYGFLSFDGYDWRVVDATDVDAHALWELLDYHGRSSVVVNVPVTGPPQPIDGAVIPGYTAPDEPVCHPSGLLSDVRNAVGTYRVYPPETECHDEYVAAARSLVRSRGEAFRYLCERFEPDFGFVQFQQTDTVFHDRPNDDKAIREVYDAVDRQVGALLETYDPGLVAIVSDHGMGPMDGSEFRVNDFLRDSGYLTVTRGGRTPSWSSVKKTQLQGSDKTKQSTQSPTERAVGVLARLGLTSQRIDRALSTVGLRDLVLRIVPARVVQAAAERPDLRTSQAYMRDRIECGVRLNLAGREPAGTVPDCEYDRVRAALRERLQSVETPDGEPVFERVVPRENVYYGPHVDAAPDLVTVPREFDEMLSSSLRGEQFGPVPESYNHKFEGILAMAGPNVDTDACLDGPTLLDIAPTILSALGAPRSERFDGRPLPVVEPTETTTYPAHTTDKKGVHDSEESVKRRLADLGYIE